MAGDLRLERTGGVAGLRLRATIALAALTPEEHAGLAALLDHSSRTSGTSADRFSYRVRAGDREVRLREDEVPDSARALLDRLEAEGTLG